MTDLYSPDWQQTIVPKDAKLIDVLTALGRTGLLAVCFVDSKGVLLSIMTDSDVRRALLNGAKLEDEAFSSSNKKPFVGHRDMTPENLQELAMARNIFLIPLLDSNKKLADLFIFGRRDQRLPTDSNMPVAVQAQAPIPNAMLIQAGGLGMRLRSVLSDRPKPLAIVGTQPILSTVIQRAAGFGIRTFYVSINYMAEQLEEHLQSECYKGLDINIVREETRLGTAGSIGYIKDKIEHPLFVCNADILTTAPLDRMLHFHNQEKVGATCAVRPYHFTVPFGVVDIRGHRISSFIEKPKIEHFISAGIYILGPEACRTVEAGQFLDMPTLLGRCVESGVAPFLLHEYWVDIGSPKDFEEANENFAQHFGDRS